MQIQFIWKLLLILLLAASLLIFFFFNPYMFCVEGVGEKGREIKHRQRRMAAITARDEKSSALFHLAD